MPTIEITVVADTTPELTARAVHLLGEYRVHKAMATEGLTLTKLHLAMVANSRDHGSRFYGSYGDAAYSRADDNAGYVVIPAASSKFSDLRRGNPLAAHYWGYEFTEANLAGNPNHAKNYAIPTGAATHLRAAEMFDQLKPMIRMIGGRPVAVALALKNRDDVTKQRMKRAGLTSGGGAEKRAAGFRETVRQDKRAGFADTVVFWLVKHFTLHADPSILPSPDEYREAGMRAIRSINHRLQHQGT